jgi:hypothetical protein
MFPKLFSKSKTTIKLSEALELKETLQEKLKSNHNILKLENSVLNKQSRNYDLKKIQKESETLRENLVTLKLLIQEANLRPVGDKGKSISYWVYLLSEKKTEMLNLQAVIKEDSKTADLAKTAGKVIAKPIYSRTELEDWINKLKKESKLIEGDLTVFNNSINVELPFKSN